jgi:hypothetical protein
MAGSNPRRVGISLFDTLASLSIPNPAGSYLHPGCAFSSLRRASNPEGG